MATQQLPPGDVERQLEAIRVMEATHGQEAAEIDYAIVDELEPAAPQPSKKARGKFAKRIVRSHRSGAKFGKVLQSAIQRDGTNRYEARRRIHGPTRATSHPTRRQTLAQAVGVNAARKRWRRRQAVAAAIATAEASW